MKTVDFKEHIAAALRGLLADRKVTAQRASAVARAALDACTAHPDELPPEQIASLRSRFPELPL